MMTNKNRTYENANILLNDVLIQHTEDLFKLVEDLTIDERVREKILKILVILNDGIGEFQKQVLSILINIDMNYPKH